MLTETDITHIISELKPILVEKYAVKKIGYFGSYSTGTATDLSDIDILISFGEPVGFEFFRVQDMLENKLGIKVDLVTEKAIRPQLRETIFNQLKFV